MYESLTSGSSGPVQKVKKERKLSLLLKRTAEPLVSLFQSVTVLQLECHNKTDSTYLLMTFHRKKVYC